MNYLAHPHKTSKYLSTIPVQFDFGKKHAIIVKGSLDGYMTFTTVADIANVVAHAVDYEGEWPAIGGIRGSRVTIGEMLKIGERVLGKNRRFLRIATLLGVLIAELMHLLGQPLTIDWLEMDDLMAGDLKTDNYTRIELPSTPQEQIEVFSKMAIVGYLISSARGVWTVSDEWNRLLPDLKFTQVEDFITKYWKE